MSPLLRKRLSKLLWKMLVVWPFGFSSATMVAETPHASRGSEMDRAFKEAMDAEDRGDAERAEALLSTLHDEHPGIFAVDESLGLLLVSRGNISGALPLLEAAAREQASSDAAHVNLGAALYQLHRDEPARVEFEWAVRINPRNVSAQESLGRICMETHRPAESAKALMAAQKLKPDDPDLKLDCVTALLAADRKKEAEAMLATFEGADSSARAQSLLGEAAEKESMFQEAGMHFARAVELEPTEENAWQLSYDLLRHWAFDAAVIEFKAASAKFPESKRLRLGLGAALFGDEKYADAIPVYGDLLAGDPDNAMYAELLGMACNAPLETGSARCGALVTFAEGHPADAKAATYAASMLLTDNENERNVDMARKLLQGALATDPNLPEAQFEMGVVVQERSDWEGSIAYLERAVKLNPNLSKAHYRLARAYWKTGRRQEGDAQMELQKTSALKEQEDLRRRLDDITSLSVTVRP